MDCHFGPIADPAGLQKHLLSIPTLVDSGLFLGLADTVIVGYAQGIRLLHR
jgi:ribose 5-phosphate isomerase A